MMSVAISLILFSSCQKEDIHSSNVAYEGRKACFTGRVGMKNGRPQAALFSLISPKKGFTGKQSEARFPVIQK